MNKRNQSTLRVGLDKPAKFKKKNVAVIGYKNKEINYQRCDLDEEDFMPNKVSSKRNSMDSNQSPIQAKREKLILTSTKPEYRHKVALCNEETLPKDNKNHLVKENKISSLEKSDSENIKDASE